MANNVYVKRFKKSANNESLDFFGKVKIVTKGDNTSGEEYNLLKLMVTSDCNIKDKNGDDSIKVGSDPYASSVTISSGVLRNVTIDNSSEHVILIDKYKISRFSGRDYYQTGLRGFKFDMKAFIGCTELKNLYVGNATVTNCNIETLSKISTVEQFGAQGILTGNIGDLVLPTLKLFVVSSSPITGNISALTKVKFPVLGTLHINNTSLTGKIEDVSAPIANINVVGMTGKINGCLEDFVRAQRSAGRTSGTLNFDGYTPSIFTWKNDVAAGGLNKYLSWTADTMNYSGDTQNL